LYTLPAVCVASFVVDDCVTGIAVSPDGEYFALNMPKSEVAQVWKTRDRELLYRVEARQANLDVNGRGSLAFSSFSFGVGNHSSRWLRGVGTCHVSSGRASCLSLKNARLSLAKWCSNGALVSVECAFP